MKLISHCFQRGNIFYYRKKISAGKLKGKKTEYVFKLSLKKILGTVNYHKAILQGTLFTISAYINNNLEIYLHNKENLTLKELHNFILDLLQKYQSQAFMDKNDYVTDIGTRKKEIEEMRFNKISFYDENGVKFSGHTPKALSKEIEELEKAFDTQNKGLIRKKAYDILNRQNIITNEEIGKIEILDEDLRFQFEDSLVKKEIEILLQDMNNYHSRYKIKNEESEANELLQKLYQLPELKTILGNIEKSEKKDFDNWDFLIEQYINNLDYEKATLRVQEVAITQFSQIMKGDLRFDVPTRAILDCNSEDIKSLKPFFIDLPNLTYNGMKNWREEGIFYTIEKAKSMNNKKLGLAGIQSRVDIVIEFLRLIKLTLDKYKDLNIEMWEKFLRVKSKDLSVEDRIQNQNDRKLPLKSEYLNGFLFNRYKQKEGLRTGTEQRNFTRHTNASPHIFWSVILGIFTGARAEELAQLKISDIRKSGEILYINITDNIIDNQHIKNEASKRKTPLCNKIIELGFLNYVKNRIALNKKTLFDLKINEDGKRKDFQKSFNNDIKIYIKENYPNLPNYKFSFHGLRAHFVSAFLREDWESKEKLIQLKKLIGHTSEDIHKDITITHYDREEIELSKGKSLIDNINFEINEGYEEIKQLMIENYGEPILDLDI
jgi:integrase